MPTFVMIGQDGPQGPERRAAHRADHVAYWTALDQAGRITLGGPIRDEDDNASKGSVIVFEAPDLPEARELVQKDAYVSGGVFESLIVAPFKHVFPKQS